MFPEPRSHVLAAAVVLASLLMIPACSSDRPQHGEAITAHGCVSDHAETGIASWYGAQHHGRITASGGVYDMNGLTAAHRRLPFGTRIAVTNLANGRSLVLTVTDRGPYVRGRVIDVSRRAAEELGFRHDGLARVRIAEMGSCH